MEQSDYERCLEGNQPLMNFDEFTDRLMEEGFGELQIMYYVECAEEWNKIENLPEEYLCETYEDYLFKYLQFHTMYCNEFEDNGCIDTSKGPRLRPGFIKKLQGDKDESSEEQSLNRGYLNMIEFYIDNDIHKGYLRRWNVHIEDDIINELRESNMMLDFVVFYFRTLITGRFKLDSYKEVRVGRVILSVDFQDDVKIHLGTIYERVPFYTKVTDEIYEYRFRQILWVDSIDQDNECFMINKYEQKHKEKCSTPGGHPNKLAPFETGSWYRAKRSGDEGYDPLYPSEFGEVQGNFTKEDKAILNNGGRLYFPKSSAPTKTTGESQGSTGGHTDQNSLRNIFQEKYKEQADTLLKRIEGIGLKLDSKQRIIVNVDRNSLVLGRSGTGKTTISAFRVLFLNLLSIFSQKYNQNKSEQEPLTVKDIEGLSGPKTIFCTTSPVLTSEVRRFYQQLIENVKDLLSQRSKPDETSCSEESKENKKGSEEQTSGSPSSDLKEKVLSSLKKQQDLALEDLEASRQLQDYNNFSCIRRREYPLFLTVKKLVYMLDGELEHKFFARNKSGKIFGMDSTNQWRSEDSSGAMMINQYYKESCNFDESICQVGKELAMDQDLEQEQIQEFLLETTLHYAEEAEEGLELGEEMGYESQEGYKRNSRIDTQLFTQEVDFEMFEGKFWHQNKGSIQASALNVWTEIYSVIKGGLKSLEKSTFDLCIKPTLLDDYCKLPSSFIHDGNKILKKHVYMIYLKYEKWKSRHHYYDFMDVVQHVYKHFLTREIKTPIDFLVVDEIQDLSPLTVQVLLMATNGNAYFCGDTAQTIAKGATFRFYDMMPAFVNSKKLIQDQFYSCSTVTTTNSIYDQLSETKYYQDHKGYSKTVVHLNSLWLLDIPKLNKWARDNWGRKIPLVHQLTTNYRSHKNILKLANSVVDIIELYFPHTIDKLEKETSKIEGPKPIVLDGFDHKDLQKLMISSESSSSTQFGCNQVVIVRNQESKKKIPDFLKRALCLTVYEAKGLEFDDVILYDFFTDTPSAGKWRIIKEITVQTVKRVKEYVVDNFRSMQDYLRWDSEEPKQHYYYKPLRKDSEEPTQEEALILQSSRDPNDVIKNFDMLNNELKYLYVAITRPKTNLIIYDSDPKHRDAMVNYWASLDLVDIVQKGNEKDHPVLSKAFELFENTEELQQKWRALGIKLFKRKFYESAINCFKESGDADLLIRTIGYMNAEEANKKMSESEALLFQAKSNINLSKFLKRQKKKQGKDLKKEAIAKFEEAAKSFEEIKLYNKAAQCYFTCGDLKKAGELFEANKQYSQAAECLKMAGENLKAAKMFEDDGLYMKSFECYEQEKDWENLILCLSRNKDNFEELERESLINRYMPIALQAIYQNVSQATTNEEEKEENLKEKYFKNEAIEEEKEDAEYSDLDDEQEECQEDSEEENKINPEQKKGKHRVVDQKHDGSDISAFSLISKHDLDHNFEHLSAFDPDDKFLKSESSFAIIGSVVCNDEKTLSQYSDISVVSGSRVGEIRGGQELSSYTDLYIQDIAVQKIIYYCSLFSEDVKKSLQNQRSNQGLVKLDGKDQINYLEIELDSIDDESISSLLNMLEHFDLFRLCLILCNRYNLKSHISRYLNSACFKYSNLKYLTMINVIQINTKRFRENQKHVNYLANEAIHNILQCIDQSSITQKLTEEMTPEECQSENWKFMFYLGFWKKLIYLIDTHNSLKLSYSIGEFKDFKTVYLVNYRPDLSNEEIKNILSSGDPCWANTGHSALVEYLCQKVLLEESSETNDNTGINEICQCNINLNEFHTKYTKNGIDAIGYLFTAISTADKKLNQYCSTLLCKDESSARTAYSDPSHYDSKELYFENLLPLFDIFLFYGRILNSKFLKDIIRDNVDNGDHIRYKVVKLSTFLLNLFKNPSKYMNVLSSEQVKVVMHAIAVGYRIRVPESSDFLMSTISVGYLHKDSKLFGKLNPIIKQMNNYRLNHELLKVSIDHIKNRKTINFNEHSPIVTHMYKIENSFGAKDDEYDRIFISDLEATYVTLGFDILCGWFRDIVLSFVNNTIVKKSTQDVQEYTEQSLYWTNNYLEALPSYELKTDYQRSLELFAANLILLNQENLGSLERSSLSRNKHEPKGTTWISNSVDDMLDTIECIKELIGRKPLAFQLRTNTIQRDRMHLLKVHEVITFEEDEAKLKSIESCNKTSVKLNGMLEKNLEFLSQIQVNINTAGQKLRSIEHDYLMQKAHRFFQKAIQQEYDETLEFETLEQQRFSLLVQSVFLFNKADRLDVISKYTQLEYFKKIYAEDIKTQQNLKNIMKLVNALESYHIDKWEDCIQNYLEFLKENHKNLTINQWLRTYETIWYLCIGTLFGSKYPLNIPLNALNYLHPEAVTAPKTCQDMFTEIPQYHNPNQVHPVKSLNPSVFLDLLNHYQAVEESRLFSSPSDHHKCLVAVYNMVSSLVTNCETLTDHLCESIEQFIESLESCDTIQGENFDKFYDYFGDKTKCLAFRDEYFEIEDYDKNDALFRDQNEDAHNQYLVMLTFEEVKSIESFELKQNEQLVQKNRRMLAYRKICRILNSKIGTFMDSLMSKKERHVNDSLSINEYNWINLHSNDQNMSELSQQILQNEELLPIINKFYQHQNRLINIMNNPYSIRSALDTHFIVSKLRELENLLAESKLDLENRVTEASSEINEADSSPNPFVDFGSDGEQDEEAYSEDISHHDKIQDVITEFVDELADKEEEFAETLQTWMDNLPEEIEQNIFTKQETLKNKLRWEGLISSNQKVKRLQLLLHKVRATKT